MGLYPNSVYKLQCLWRCELCYPAPQGATSKCFNIKALTQLSRNYVQKCCPKVLSKSDVLKWRPTLMSKRDIQKLYPKVISKSDVKK